jgi:hypothetical protein
MLMTGPAAEFFIKMGFIRANHENADAAADRHRRRVR